MRKIPERFENPIDNVLISHIDSIKSHFFKLGFTPNILTTLSIFCNLVAMYFFVNNQEYSTVYSVIFFILSYYLDCFDGHFARSYNMVTRFGDYYDHISDWFKIMLFIWLIYTHFKPYFYVSFIFVFIFTVLSTIHISCQEYYYGKHVDTLYLLKYICPINYFNVTINECLNITKYVGCGTYMLIAIIIIIYLKTNQLTYASTQTRKKKYNINT
jgi:phosphatidylglycerophosphate synthase